MRRIMRIPSASRPRSIFRAGVALAISALVASAAPSEIATGVVHGRVVLDVEDARLSDDLPMVVYLEAAAGSLRYRVQDLPTPAIHQKYARFDPAFLVIAAGQTVEMPNDDRIFHNVFSFSRPNQFDLGIYPRGESRRVTFRYAGVVRMYCSIHSSMSATIVVAPSPYYALAKPDGAFEIRGVPPGRYRIRTWCERLPQAGDVVEILADRDTEIRLAIR